MSQESPDRHICHCGKSFLRKEHLKRHQATHGERSHICHICSRSFTRNDLLRRHINVHESAPLPDTRRNRACDACHDNKTKCDGGEKCSLCKKRGIDCTYDRPTIAGTTSAPHVVEQQEPVIAAQTLVAARDVAQVREAQEIVDHSTREEDSPAPTISTASNAGHTSPNRPAEDTARSDNEVATAQLGLRSVLDAMSISRSGSDSWRESLQADVLKGWVASAIESFFQHFSCRWPIIHEPTFDETELSASVIASVLAIGSWLQGAESVKESAIEVHKALVAQFFEEMAITQANHGDDQPWPHETYQATLVNIIFAFETGNEQIIARARVLHGLFVATLREKGAFNSEAVEHQRATHHPGTFIPWVHMTYERWSRIAAGALIIDTYLSLLSGQPPVLQREELDLILTSTCAAWNAHGLNVFFKRYREEPLDRTKARISELTSGSIPTLSSGILIEDIQIGLCGVRREIWNYTQTRANNPALPLTNPLQDSLAQQLDVWKFELDKILVITNGPRNTGPFEKLMKFYLMKEDPSSDNWTAPVMTRISVAIFNTTILYHLLSVHLYADIRNLWSVITGSSTLWSNYHIISTNDAERQARLQQWAITSDSRKALLHALSILKAYGGIKSTIRLQSGSLDPVAFMGLEASALVVCTLLLAMGDTCLCVPGVGHVDIDTELLVVGHGPRLTEWIQDGGLIQFSGVPICNCALATWIALFFSALTGNGQSWEHGSRLARTLRSNLTGVK